MPGRARRSGTVAEPILLLAHEDRDALLAADVQIDYATDDAELRSRGVDRSTFKTIAIEKGDVDAGFAAADVVVEGEYRTGHQEQLYIEPNGVDRRAAEADGGHHRLRLDAVPVLRASRRCKVLLGLPDDKVRVVQTETGGGFGGKEEYPSMIAGHAALLALKAGRPVKIDLRPRRGHGGDDQAPSVDRPPSHRRDARRPADRDGHRRAVSTAARTRR